MGPIEQELRTVKRDGWPFTVTEDTYWFILEVADDMKLRGYGWIFTKELFSEAIEAASILKE